MGRTASISVARDSPDEAKAPSRDGTPVSQAAFASLPALVVAPDGTLKFSTAHAAPLIEAAAASALRGVGIDGPRSQLSAREGDA